MSVTDWSVAPAANATVDPGIPAHDGASARSMPELVRAVMAGVAALRNISGGALYSESINNVYTVNTGAGVTPGPGVTISFWADQDNTAPPFLNIDGSGPKPWKDADGQPFATGAIQRGRYYTVAWSEALPGSVLEWRDAAASGSLSIIRSALGPITIDTSGVMAGVTALNLKGSPGTTLFARPPINLADGVAFYSATSDFSTAKGLELRGSTILFTPTEEVRILPTPGSFAKALHVVQTGPASGMSSGPKAFNTFDMTFSSKMTGNASPGLPGSAFFSGVEIALNVGGPEFDATQVAALSAGLTHNRSDVSYSDKIGASFGLHSTASSNGLLDAVCAGVFLGEGGYSPQVAAYEADVTIVGNGTTPLRFAYVAANTGAKTGTRIDAAFGVTSAGPDGTSGGSWKSVIALFKGALTLPDAVQPDAKFFLSDHNVTFSDFIYAPNVNVSKNILHFPHARLRGDGVLSLGDVEPTLIGYGRLHIQASQASMASMLIEPGVAPDAQHIRVGAAWFDGQNLYIIDNQGSAKRFAYAA